jgi:signal transduction histidine kinase
MCGWSVTRIVPTVSTFAMLEAAARRIDPRVADTTLAAVLGVVAAVSEISHPRPFVAVPAALVLAATVAVRRAAPVAAALVALGASAGLSSWVDAALLALPVLGVSADPHTSSPGGTLVLDVLFVWSFFFAIPYGAGRAVRSRTTLNAELQVNTERLEQQEHERARQAVIEERTRIARELHDVVAHSVSVMVIQTAAARAVARRDPAAAAAALGSVESCGRDALVDMRRMVGVLHRSDIDLLSGTSPGLSQLGTLAERARASGLPVQVTVEGEARALPAALDLVSFRIVQEALTNAIKHAGPARALVRVTFTADCLRLEIVDTGRGPLRRRGSSGAAGHGLVGMRERLSLYGGDLRTGHRSGGGYEVVASIPLAEPVPS